MDSAETVHRLHFAFTVVYHYLFPQLTMGLALRQRENPSALRAALLGASLGAVL